MYKYKFHWVEHTHHHYTSLSIDPRVVLRHGPDLEADDAGAGPGAGHQPQPRDAPRPHHLHLHAAAPAGLRHVRDVPQAREVIL